jgi:hypothetical protein
MTNTRPYSQDASQSERAKMLKQDIDALRRAVSPDVNSAKDPTSLYPRMPDSSPWAQPGPGLEPPLALSERRRR